MLECDLLLLFLWENDGLFELISSKFLTESRYSVSVQAAAMRLLFCCSITWTYPHVFEDDLLENIRGCVINEIPRSSVDDFGRRKTSVSTGLLVVCLACGGQLVEDVLKSGLPAKLMQYLHIRVLGETSTSQIIGRAFSKVIDATNAVTLSRTTAYVDDDSGQSKPMETDVNEDIGELVILDSDSLAKLREKFCIQCLVILGEHVEVLCVVLCEKGVDVTLALLQRSLKHKESSSTVLLLNDILKLICVLAAHRKFAALFVYHGGIQRLLAVPRIVHTFFGLSSCLLTIGSIKGIMQCICAFPSYVVDQVVELALQLLECQQDESRKNAALFFARAFVFRAIIIAFDGRYGLQKLLRLLHDSASMRFGVTPGQLNNPGSLQNDRSPSEVQTTYEMQIAYHTCVALR